MIKLSPVHSHINIMRIGIYWLSFIDYLLNHLITYKSNDLICLQLHS